jgi:malate dehydrogenase (oxaloacetate-decarboxylating)(NADP+)
MEASEVVAAAYGGSAPVFGPSYIIPKPFDPRLILQIAPAVARAAMASGVATRPITDFAAYHEELEVFVFRSGQVMRPVIEAARRTAARIVYAEGEDERVLRAVQTLVDDGIAQPILLGRRQVIQSRIATMGLRMRVDTNVQVLDPAQDHAVFKPMVRAYQVLVGRRGIPAEGAERLVHSRNAVAACMLLHTGQVDAAIVGGVGDWWRTMHYVMPVIPRAPTASRIYALSGLILQTGILFVADTHMNVDPTAEQIVEMTLLGAAAVRGFGITPKAALLSHSSFGSSNTASSRKMRHALALIRAAAPDLEIDGEMHSDAALSEAIRDKAVPDSPLTGAANLLIMPNLDSANIAFNLLKAAAEGLPIGPMLLGMSQPIQVLVPSVTARGIVNISALAAQAVRVKG